jgi:phage host-nuclease inhibitor protein Gam
MKKNPVGIILCSLIILALVISNLFFLKKTMDLNEEITRLFELQNLISEMEIRHQKEVDELNRTYEEKLAALTNEYTEKFETVKKALNAFEYELEEFYRNKHILKEDYLKNLQKIRDIQEKLDDGE